MGKDSGIQWTDATVNFWIGCRKVSAGCKYCYMFRDQLRWNRDPEDIHRTSDNTFHAALKWREPRRIFTCSWSDFFIPEADAWRKDAWDVIRKTPQHQWQILTKRPERILECLPPDWGAGWENVWLGVTVEDKKSIYRMHELAVVPAHIRFLSCEPLLEYIDLLNEENPKMGNEFYSITTMNWVILGGESGNENGEWKYRPMELRWLDMMINDLKDIPFHARPGIFVKQLGTYQAKQMHLSDRHGGNMDEWPEPYQIREDPVVDGNYERLS